MRIMLIRKSKFRGDNAAINAQTKVLYKTVEQIKIPAKSWSSLDRIIPFPAGYNQQSITRDVGAKRISVKHSVVIVLTKHNIINSKKTIMMELPIYIGEQRGEHAGLKALKLVEGELTASVEEFSV